MAVVSVHEIPEQARASGSRLSKKYSRTFAVQLDSVVRGEIVALTADDGTLAIPIYGAYHPNNVYAYVVNKASDPGEGRLIWMVRVDYETPQRESNYEEDADPLDDPVDINWTFTARTEVADKDKDGVAILNSAQDWFDPPLEQEVHDLAVTITRNDAVYVPLVAHNYVDSVNSDALTIAGLAITARQAKLVELSGNKAERNGVVYWVVTYRIEFRAATWDRNVLDQGLNYLDGAGKKQPCMESKTEKVTEPVRLNGSGGYLTVPGAEEKTAAQSVWSADYGKFRIYQEKSFGTLGLPTTVLG